MSMGLLLFVCIRVDPSPLYDSEREKVPESTDTFLNAGVSLFLLNESGSLLRVRFGSNIPVTYETGLLPVNESA